MNINAHNRPRLPQFSSQLKDPQKIDVTYTAPTLERVKLGEIPDDYEDFEAYYDRSESGVPKHLYKPGEEFHKNPEGHTKYVNFKQPVREANGTLVPTKLTKRFHYNPDEGLSKRRFSGAMLGAVLGTAAGAAVSLLTGSDLFTSILLGTTAGTGTGALARWNSKAPIPSIEWEQKQVDEAKLVGYERTLRPWVECSFRGDHCWPVVDNNFEPILEKNVVGSFYEPVLKSQ